MIKQEFCEMFAGIRVFWFQAACSKRPQDLIVQIDTVGYQNDLGI